MFLYVEDADAVFEREIAVGATELCRSRTAKTATAAAG